MIMNDNNSFDVTLNSRWCLFFEWIKIKQIHLR